MLLSFLLVKSLRLAGINDSECLEAIDLLRVKDVVDLGRRETAAPAFRKRRKDGTALQAEGFNLKSPFC
jgi:hypothetical protein